MHLKCREPQRGWWGEATLGEFCISELLTGLTELTSFYLIGLENLSDFYNFHYHVPYFRKSRIIIFFKSLTLYSTLSFSKQFHKLLCRKTTLVLGAVLFRGTLTSQAAFQFQLVRPSFPQALGPFFSTGADIKKKKKHTSTHRRLQTHWPRADTLKSNQQSAFP